MKYRPATRWRPYVKAILDCGHWEATDRLTDGGAHAVLCHPETGQTVTYGLHDGGNDWNGCRNMAKAAQDICGCVFVEPRNRKRSRKAVQVSGFDVTVATREQAMFRQRVGGSIEELQARHARLKAELAALMTANDRTAVAKARKIFADLADIETDLTALHQPFQPFQPAV